MTGLEPRTPRRYFVQFESTGCRAFVYALETFKHNADAHNGFSPHSAVDYNVTKLQPFEIKFRRKRYLANGYIIVPGRLTVSTSDLT